MINRLRIARLDQSSLLNGLISYYKMEGTGRDSGIGGNHGTLTDASVTFQSSATKIGGMGLDNNSGGSGASLNLGAVLWMASGQVTVSAWIHTSNVSQNAGLVSKWQQGGNAANHFLLVLGQDVANARASFGIQQSDGTGKLVPGATNIIANAWTHLVGVADGRNVLFYLNGKVDGSTTYDGTMSTFANAGAQNCRIGCLRSDTVYLYNGNIDEVGFWNRGLSPSEVQRLYNNGAGMSHPFR